MTSAMITAIGTIGTFLVALLTFYFGVYLPLLPEEEHLPSPPSSDTTKNVTSSSPPSSDTT